MHSTAFSLFHVPFKWEDNKTKKIWNDRELLKNNLLLKLI